MVTILGLGHRVFSLCDMLLIQFLFVGALINIVQLKYLLVEINGIEAEGNLNNPKGSARSMTAGNKTVGGNSDYNGVDYYGKYLRLTGNKSEVIIKGQQKGHFYIDNDYTPNYIKFIYIQH